MQCISRDYSTTDLVIGGSSVLFGLGLLRDYSIIESSSFNILASRPIRLLTGTVSIVGMLYWFIEHRINSQATFSHELNTWHPGGEGFMES
ncbi:MAG: hypothetical protein JSR80_06555 [Verrucomicrobia bacterium]|nr:hypothetical protein [Verrucomicrobiota bacterium]